MKFYNDKNNIVMVQSVASASTYVSSITGIIKKRILAAFPKEYFKHIYTDTAETFQEQNKNNLYNKTLNKIEYPSLSVSPQLSLDNPVYGLKNTLMSSPNFWVARDLARHYPCLLEDPDDKYKIFYTVDNTTMNVKFKIIVNTFEQATRCSYWLKSRFDDNTFKYIDNQLIQTEVPKSLVTTIAKIENLFTTDDSITNQEDLAKLDELLTARGQGAKRIIRKRSLNTGKDCYFFDQQENLLTLFTDLDIPDMVVRDGGVGSEYEISFRIQVTGWWVNAFIMSVNTAKLTDKSSFIEVDTSMDSGSDGNFTSASIGSPIALDRKTTINFLDNEGGINTGLNIIHQTFTFNKSTNLQRINFSYFLSEYVLKIHSYAKEKGYNLTKLFNVIARSYVSNSLTLGTIDYENLYIDFENSVDTEIVLDVFVNRAMLESLNITMETDSFYSNDHAMTALDICYYDDDGTKQVGKVRIYKFNSPDEYYDTTIEKAFRINTQYGIGYIGLVPEGNVNASNFKIYLGNDRYGNKIIRCLEKV